MHSFADLLEGDSQSTVLSLDVIKSILLDYQISSMVFSFFPVLALLLFGALQIPLSSSSASSCKEDIIDFNDEEYWLTKSGVPSEVGIVLASEKGDVNLVRCLLEKGSAVDAIDNDGWSGLLMAAWFNHMDILNILLEHGANINIQSLSGWTAAMCAADRDNLEIFLRLEEKGADMMLEDIDGDTMFMKALDGALDNRERVMTAIRSRAMERDKHAQQQAQAAKSWAAAVNGEAKDKKDL